MSEADQIFFTHQKSCKSNKCPSASIYFHPSTQKASTVRDHPFLFRVKGENAGCGKNHSQTCRSRLLSCAFKADCGEKRNSHQHPWAFCLPEEAALAIKFLLPCSLSLSHLFKWLIALFFSLLYCTLFLTNILVILIVCVPPCWDVSGQPAVQAA